MSTPTGSLFPVQRENALRAAKKAIRFAEDSHANAWNKAMSKALTPRRVWFRMKTRTPAEARAYLNERVETGFGFSLPADHAFREPNSWAREWGEGMALSLGTSSGDVVYLDAKDARLVSLFLEGAYKP